jgi:1D-myo-inositol 3-kinase
MSTAPHLLVVGNVCRDTINGEYHLGGASAFGSRAASHLGVRTAMVTAAPARFKLLSRIRQDPFIRLLRCDSSVPTAFRFGSLDGVRQLYLEERARDLSLAHIPPALRATPVAYVAPIMNECHRDLIEGLRSPCLVVGAQGWMRSTGPDGLVIPDVKSELLDPPSTVRAMVYSELDHPDGVALAQRLARRGIVVAVTRGAAGLTLWAHGACTEIPAFPANEVDPTGAGDVFAVVFALTLAEGHTPEQAAARGALAAARVVEGPEMGNLVPDFDSQVMRAG